MLKFIGAVTCVGFAALVLVVIFAVAGSSHRSSSSSFGNTDSATLGPAMRVSAMKLAVDYHANEVQADNVYRGKHLLVTGLVTSINKDAFDHIYLALASENEFMQVHANLQESEAGAAANLHTMQLVNVDCIGGEMVIGSPQLNNCTIVQEAPVNALVTPSEPETNPQPSPNSEESSISPADVQPGDPDWDLYRNQRFGFSFRYPHSFAQGPIPENGDGLSLSSSDGAKITVSGSNNNGSSLHEYYEERLKRLPGNPTYAREAGSWFVISWHDGGKIAYLKMFVGTGSVNILTIEYPDSGSTEYNEVAEQVERSFVPGDVSQTW